MKLPLLKSANHIHSYRNRKVHTVSEISLLSTLAMQIRISSVRKLANKRRVAG